MTGNDIQRKRLLEGVGIKPTKDVRGQMDVVGYAVDSDQMDSVVAQCEKLSVPRREYLSDIKNWHQKDQCIAGVCPHDDYYYAGRHYSLLMPHIQSRTVILTGVAHKGRYFDCENRLVFDDFKAWRSPYGSIKISPLRETIIKNLKDEEYMISNDMHQVEHSLEAIAYFLQAYNRDVEIIPVIIPNMEWSAMNRLSGRLSNILTEIMNEKKWKAGSDISLICSNDSVHYGDSGWGKNFYAPFGTDVAGYQMAVKQDRDLAERFLSGKVNDDKLKAFLYKCTDPDDMYKYRITWCGRFAVTFGLMTASRLCRLMESRPLFGVLLDYGTSVSEESPDFSGLKSLGPTAPNNFHHFVGYAAIGYL